MGSKKQDAQRYRVGLPPDQPPPPSRLPPSWPSQRPHPTVQLNLLLDLEQTPCFFLHLPVSLPSCHSGLSLLLAHLLPQCSNQQLIAIKGRLAIAVLVMTNGVHIDTIRQTNTRAVSRASKSMHGRQVRSRR